MPFFFHHWLQTHKVQNWRYKLNLTWCMYEINALIPNLVLEYRTLDQFRLYVKAECIQSSSQAACLHLQWRHQEESFDSQSEPCFLISLSADRPEILCPVSTERDALHTHWHHHPHHHLIPNLQHQLNHGYDWVKSSCLTDLWALWL